MLQSYTYYVCENRKRCVNRKKSIQKHLRTPNFLYLCSMELEVKIRRAYIDDAEFIAECVLKAVGIKQIKAKQLNDVLNIVKLDYTLYSWRNTFVAEIEGKLVGAIISYDGCQYAEMRHNTFELIRKQSGKDFSAMDIETKPGEWYLDSLAVRWGYRNQGIGTKLINAAIQEGQKNGINTFSLACEHDNKKAFQLYLQLGFITISHIHIFDDDYLKMEWSAATGA